MVVAMMCVRKGGAGAGGVGSDTVGGRALAGSTENESACSIAWQSMYGCFFVDFSLQDW